MRSPVNYFSVTQKFKNSGVGKHYGLDLGWNSKKGGKNQPIYAIDDGVVIYNRKQKTGGYVIHIRHDNGFVSEYGHLLKNSQKVKEGQKVKKGQQIAQMGNSGIAIGNHLHFGIYRGTSINYSKKSNFVNPLDYINLYDNQTANKSSSKLIKHTKRVRSKDGLRIRNKPINGKIVKNAKYNEEVECYGLKDGWNIVDNVRGYYCSNKWLK